MPYSTKRGRLREILRSVGISLAMTIATLAVLEVVLRVADFRELREGVSERSLSYQYDFRARMGADTEFELGRDQRPHHPRQAQ